MQKLLRVKNETDYSYEDRKLFIEVETYSVRWENNKSHTEDS